MHIYGDVEIKKKGITILFFSFKINIQRIKKSIEKSLNK